MEMREKLADNPFDEATVCQIMRPSLSIVPSFEEAVVIPIPSETRKSSSDSTAMRKASSDFPVTKSNQSKSPPTI
jgi:hypothetical protein